MRKKSECIHSQQEHLNTCVHAQSDIHVYLAGLQGLKSNCWERLLLLLLYHTLITHLCLLARAMEILRFLDIFTVYFKNFSVIDCVSQSDLK